MSLLAGSGNVVQLTDNITRWHSKIQFLKQTPKTRHVQPRKKKTPGLADDDFYYTPEGFVVFTATYHLKRGYCCKNGCRHCPYGFKKKAE